jgi:hypothetical protein
MSFIPHLDRAGLQLRNPTAPNFEAWPMVDNLYDFTAILSDTKPIAIVPGPLLGTRVAIVGAGLAGIVAAYELFRAGLNPVIYEATGRIGGRTFSQPFGNSSSKDAPIAELGAMRVPTSCKVFYYYAGYLRGPFCTFRREFSSLRRAGLLSSSEHDSRDRFCASTRATCRSVPCARSIRMK